MARRRYQFPLRRDFDAWARGYLAQAVHDRAHRLFESHPDGELEEDVLPEDARRYAQKTVDALEIALAFGHLDQRPELAQRQLLAKQVYDTDASTARYVIFFGEDWGCTARLLVDDLKEVSLFELAELFEQESELVISISTPSGRRMPLAERRALAKQLKEDLFFDAREDELRIDVEYEPGGIRAHVQWLETEEASEESFERAVD